MTADWTMIASVIPRATAVTTNLWRRRGPPSRIVTSTATTQPKYMLRFRLSAIAATIRHNAAIRATRQRSFTVRIITSVGTVIAYTKNKPGRRILEVPAVPNDADR